MPLGSWRCVIMVAHEYGEKLWVVQVVPAHIGEYLLGPFLLTVDLMSMTITNMEL